MTSFSRRCRHLFEAVRPALGPPGTEAIDDEATWALLAAPPRGGRRPEASRSGYERELALAQSALESALGEGETADMLRRSLSERDRWSWESERSELEPLIDSLNRAEEDAVRRHQTIAEDMGRLAGSQRIAELERRREGLEVELDAALHRYLVLGTARALLQRTLTRHERERQPEVIAAAASHFERVTAGRYVGLLADSATEGRHGLRVRSGHRGDHRGPASQPGHLGAAVPVPPPRTRRLLRQALSLTAHRPRRRARELRPGAGPRRGRGAGGLGAAHQIVFLTCHPHLAAVVLKGRRPPRRPLPAHPAWPPRAGRSRYGAARTRRPHRPARPPGQSRRRNRGAPRPHRPPRLVAGE